MTIVGGFFVAVFAVGAILPDVEPTSDAATSANGDSNRVPPAPEVASPVAKATPSPVARETPSVEPTIAPAAPTSEPSAPSPTTPPPVAGEAPTPGPTPTTDAAAVGDIPARLVLNEDPGASVQAIRDVEDSLAQVVVNGLEQETWWPYVGEVVVDEDLFQSDVRLRLDVLVHPDVLSTGEAMCEAAVAILPATDESIAVYVEATSPYAGGQEIDGSDEPWKMGHTIIVRGSNSDTSECRPDEPSETEMERIERYIAEER